MGLQLKSYWNFLKLRLYRFLYVWNNRVADGIFNRGYVRTLSDIKDRNFMAAVAIRTWEATVKEDFENQITGNSIIHLGENLFENCGVQNLICTAIGGDTIDTLFARRNYNIFPYRSKRLCFHECGNDFLGGQDPDWIFDKFCAFIDSAGRKRVKDIGWVEIVPLGDPEKSSIKAIRENQHGIRELNFRIIPEFIERVIRSGVCDVIRIRDRLQSVTGYIDEKYGLPDKIHVNKLAYAEVLVPAVREWFIAKGAHTI